VKYEVTWLFVGFLGLLTHSTRHEGRPILHPRWYFQF
jgi:hypothetical protein